MPKKTKVTKLTVKAAKRVSKEAVRIGKGLANESGTIITGVIKGFIDVSSPFR